MERFILITANKYSNLAREWSFAPLYPTQQTLWKLLRNEYSRFCKCCQVAVAFLRGPVRPVAWYLLLDQNLFFQPPPSLILMGHKLSVINIDMHI